MMYNYTNNLAEGISDRTDYPIPLYDYSDFIVAKPKIKHTWKSDKFYWLPKVYSSIKTQVIDIRKMGAR